MKTHKVSLRLNLELGPSTHQSLKELQTTLEATSQVEVIRLALQTLHKLVEEVRAGGDIAISNRDGERVRILLPIPTGKTSIAFMPSKHLDRPLHRVTREVDVAKSNRRTVGPQAGGEKWEVKAPGAARASAIEKTQSAAIDRAREILKNTGGGELTIKGRDGKIRDSDTVSPARDPFPPRDTK